MREMGFCYKTLHWRVKESAIAQQLNQGDRPNFPGCQLRLKFKTLFEIDA